MTPSYFKIEILAIQDEFVLLGHKGLMDHFLYTRISHLLLKLPAAGRHFVILVCYFFCELDDSFFEIN